MLYRTGTCTVVIYTAHRHCATRHGTSHDTCHALSRPPHMNPYATGPSAGPSGASLRRKDAPRTQERSRQQAFRAIGRIPEGGIPCRVGRGEKPPFKVIDTAPFFRLDTVTLADPSGKPKLCVFTNRFSHNIVISLIPLDKMMKFERGNSADFAL